MANELKQAALDAITRGWKVFPVHARSKTPATTHGFLDWTDDPESVEQVWDMNPNFNLGVTCGSVSGGLLVLDFDVDESEGIDSIHDVLVPWEKEHGELPETVTEITGRGGMHYFYRTDRPIRKSENQELHVDVRAEGSYVMIAPSIHPNGNRVEWENHPDDYEIADADENVYALLEYVQEKAGGEGEKLDLSEGMQKGSRNVTLFKLACSLMSNSLPDSAIVHSVRGMNESAEEPLPEAEVEKILKSALALPKGKSLEFYKGKGIKTDDGTFEQRKSVYGMLELNGRNRPFDTISNCMVVLENDPRLKGRFCYNDIAYTRTVECPVPWDGSVGTRRIIDTDYTEFAAYLETGYGLMNKNKARDAVLNVCYRHHYNPILEWLESLEWDGQERVGTLLAEFMKAEHNEYNSEVMKLFMRGAVARVVYPGCKFDSMIVLVGPQGVGKSTFLRMLAHQDAWYNGDFDTVEGDGAIEKLQGKWILEMGELLALKKAKELEAVKAFITNQVDTIRPKYGRETEDRPRCCVFAGTTNNFDFLSDPTGNRRFLPVKCNMEQGDQRLLFVDGVQEHFDQCWAETYHKWKEGERSLVLPESVKAQAESMREEHTEDDPRVGLIQNYVDAQIQKAPFVNSFNVCVPEILDKVLDVRDFRNAPIRLVREIHAILRNSIEGIRPYENSRGRKVTEYGLQKVYVVDESSPRISQLGIKISH